MKRKGFGKVASCPRTANREGDVTHKLLLGAEDDLIRNDYGIAEAAGLDGDELGCPLAATAKIKRVA